MRPLIASTRLLFFTLLGIILAGGGLFPCARGVDLPLRWRWSQPAPHGGNIFDQNFGLGLGIQVAERGQIYTSEDFIFWEPRTSPTTRSLRAVTFLGNRIVISGENGTILFADSLATFQSLDLGTADWLEGLAASTNLVVAVGDNGAVYTTPDGAQWTRQPTSFTTWLRGVAQGLGTWVAVGEDGWIVTSPDGTNWTRRTSNTTQHLNRVAWIGDRFWVVGDNGIVRTSPAGGANWSVVESGTGQKIFSASGNMTERTLVGDETVRLRNEGGNFLDQMNPDLPYPAPLWTYYNTTWQDKFFFLTGRSGMMVEGFQTNNLTSHVWINRNRSYRNWLWEVQRLPDFYIAVGFAGTILTSVDGIDWSLELTPDSATNAVLLGVGGTTNLLLAVGNAGTILASPRIASEIVRTNPSDGSSQTNLLDSQGIFWHAVQPNPTTNDLQGVTIFNEQYFVSGDLGTVLTTSDGTNWIHQSPPTTAFLSGITAHPNGLVAVGQGGTLLTSPDGVDWKTPASLPRTTNWIFRVRYVGDVLIAVGQNGTIFTSPNAVNWSLRQAPTERWLNDVAFAENTWFIVGNQGTVLISTNTQEWQSIGSITEKSLFGVANHEGQLIVAGVEGAILRSPLRPLLGPVNFVDYSRDSDRNLFLLSGQPDQQFVIERSSDFSSWQAGPVFEFWDSSGTALILDPPDTNGLTQTFFRARPVP